MTKIHFFFSLYQAIVQAGWRCKFGRRQQLRCWSEIMRTKLHDTLLGKSLIVQEMLFWERKCFLFTAPVKRTTAATLAADDHTRPNHPDEHVTKFTKTRSHTPSTKFSDAGGLRHVHLELVAEGRCRAAGGQGHFFERVFFLTTIDVSGRQPRNEARELGDAGTAGQMEVWMNSHNPLKGWTSDIKQRRRSVMLTLHDESPRQCCVKPHVVSTDQGAQV